MKFYEFPTIYRQAMRAQAPRMFNELARSGKMKEHLREKSKEADQLLTELTKGLPRGQDGYLRDKNAHHNANEQVLSLLLDFPSLEQTTSSSMSDKESETLPTTAPLSAEQQMYKDWSDQMSQEADSPFVPHPAVKAAMERAKK